MAEEKILTLHPEGKQGVNIDLKKYQQMAEAILQVLQHEKPTSTELTASVSDILGSGFDGSIAWYLISVKLDLEARKTIRRIPNTRPERYQLV